MIHPSVDAASCPQRLRGDLTVSRQQAAGGTVFIVHDPVSGGFFRLQEVERFIAEQLDGATSLEVIRRRTEARFAASLSAPALAAFVARLEKSGLLETARRGGSRSAARGERVRGSLLYLRFPLLDPDRVLDRLVRRARFLFTPAFIALAAAFMLLAAAITLANGPAIARDVSRLLSVTALPLWLAVLLGVVSAHEFAHALTCKRFGGAVREMGFMLMYFQPAFYTDVSAAWLFPEKARRLWVSLAGPYFELFLWALATLAWRVTDGDTWINSLAVMVTAVSGVKSLLNFNPFIKLDGYYVLSDFLDIPNLRRKAFEYTGARIKRLLGLGSGVVAAVTRRERTIYLTYGVAATVFSVSLLAYVFVQAGGFLIEARQPAVLALLTGFVGMRFRQRYRRLFGGSPEVDELTGGEDHVERERAAVAPEPAEPVEPKRKTSRRQRARRRRIGWAAALAAFLAVVLFGRADLRVGGSFIILPEQNADVRALVDGVVEEVRVTEGDVVAPGDVIARLTDRAQVVELSKKEADVRETRARLQRLEAGPTPEEIAVARAAVAGAENRLAYAQTRAARLRGLLEAQVVTHEDAETAQELAAVAANDLAEAKSRLTVLTRGSRREDIDESRARLDRLVAEQRYLEDELRLLHIVSPVSGIVATPAQRLRTMARQFVRKGDLIVKVYETRTVTAQIVVSEKEIADVRVGQRVELRARAHPNVAFPGTVTAVAAAADGSSGADGGAAGDGGGGAVSAAGPRFIVTTRIDNHALLLKPGMTGHAKVFGDRRRIVQLVTRRLARTLRVEVWSWW